MLKTLPEKEQEIQLINSSNKGWHKATLLVLAGKIESNNRYNPNTITRNSLPEISALYPHRGPCSEQEDQPL